MNNEQQPPRFPSASTLRRSSRDCFGAIRGSWQRLPKLVELCQQGI